MSAAVVSPEDAVNAPLTLGQVVSLALQYNASLSAQQNALSGSLLSLDSSRSGYDIQLSPLGNVGFSGGNDGNKIDYSVGATVSQQFSTGSRLAVSPRVDKIDSEDGSMFQSSVGVQLTQPLFRGIRPEYNLSAVRGAEFGVRSSRRQYFLTQVDVFVQTVSGFYDILLQKQLVENRLQSVDRLAAFARTAKIKRKIGLAEAEDEYRAVQRLKQAKDDLVSAEQALKLAEDNLRRILNWPVTHPITIGGDLNQEPLTVDETEAVQAALENRVEIDEAEDLLREKYRLSRNAEHQLLPQLDVSMYYTPYGLASSFEDASVLKDSRWGVSLSTSSDLFRRTERTVYRQSLLVIEDAKRNLSSLKDDIVRQVRETIRSLNESGSRIELQKSRVQEAERQLELSRLKFKYGMANNFDLIDTESVLSSAKGNVENARARYIVGIYQLRAAMGTLLDYAEQEP